MCFVLTFAYFLVLKMQVFLSMLLKVTFLDLPLWHRILVLEILRVSLEVEHILHLHTIFEILSILFFSFVFIFFRIV